MKDRLFLVSLVLLFVQSLMLLFVWNSLLSMVLMTAGIVCLVYCVIKEHKLVCWLPMYILICEMHLFVQTGSGTLLIFYYVLLICTLLFAVFGRKKTDVTQLMLAGAFGKLCFIPEVIFNLGIYSVSGSGIYLGLSYSMLFITSSYLISALFLRAEDSDMTPVKFILPVIGLLVPGIDLVLTVIYVRRCYNESGTLRRRKSQK